jgi:hypothetical protein
MLSFSLKVKTQSLTDVQHFIVDKFVATRQLFANMSTGAYRPKKSLFVCVKVWQTSDNRNYIFVHFCLKNLHHSVVLICILQNTCVNNLWQKSIPSDISDFNLSSPIVITITDVYFVIRILKLCYGCREDLLRCIYKTILPWGIFLTTTQFHIDMLALYPF